MQLLILVILRDYYLYLLALLFGQTFNNMLTAYLAGRMYPNFIAVGSLPREEVKIINRRVKDLFTARIGGVIQSSSDSIVISAYLGLTVLGMYNNYYLIMNAVFGFIIIILNSILAGVGNSIVLESSEKII